LNFIVYLYSKHSFGRRICYRFQVLKRTYQVGPLRAILGHCLARSTGPARFDEWRGKQSFRNL